MPDNADFLNPNPLAGRLDPLWLADDQSVLDTLLADATPPDTQRAAIQSLAYELARQLRATQDQQPGLESLLSEYAISSEEGVVLMCLAEALLRIPDDRTAIEFLQDQVRAGDWTAHLAHSPSFWVNASTWGLLVCGRFLDLEARTASETLQALLKRLGEPVLLGACRRAVALIGSRFVAGRSVEEALSRAGSDQAFSFDMLGEAAMTRAAAAGYFESYAAAIDTLANRSVDNASVSVKLSALHPRYQFAHRADCIPEISDRLLELCRLAGAAGIRLTVDAEEAARLQISLEIFESVFTRPELTNWEGLGLAVQAYQKRAPAVIDWLGELAGRHGRRIPVRLVKGAYWDTEIKLAQLEGLTGYPVYLDKAATDVAWLACARRMLRRTDLYYPQFASHNAHSVASILVAAADTPPTAFELQRLHGMGEALHQNLRNKHPGLTLRTYAPVGPYRELLPYLVRRLLENGASSSFLHQLADPGCALEPLLAEPVDALGRQSAATRIPAPTAICLPGRRLAPGDNLHAASRICALSQALQGQAGTRWQSAPGVPGSSCTPAPCCSPADLSLALGTSLTADESCCEQAFIRARAAQPDWEQRGAADRAAILEKIADRFWQQRDLLTARIVMEGGRTLQSAIGEVREAMDFCYYYAQQASDHYGPAALLAGPTGEANYYRMRARGVFACISPWNFPLAIFSGQILAALAAGNSVLAKPASQTTLTAMLAVELMHAAGVPEEVLQFLPSSGAVFEQAVLQQPELAGVAFTGSNATSDRIRQTFARTGRKAIPLIAETGGINCMIVDSSALPEQVVADAILSAFDSAGQRCSALRILCLQEEIAAPICEMLAGAIAELKTGMPWDPASDLGPVIDAQAREELIAHRSWLQQHAKLIAEGPLPAAAGRGYFVAPQAWRIASIGALKQEVFGPFLHVVSWESGELDSLIDDINHLGYGLTLGIASRIRGRWHQISNRARIGNIYINRNMIGAHPGIQPFGGQGLSGTGPKAGGPAYLQRFGVEQAISVNTAAIGGNPSLLGDGRR